MRLMDGIFMMLFNLLFFMMMLNFFLLGFNRMLFFLFFFLLLFLFLFLFLFWFILFVIFILLFLFLLFIIILLLVFLVCFFFLVFLIFLLILFFMFYFFLLMYWRNRCTLSVFSWHGFRRNRIFWLSKTHDVDPGRTLPFARSFERIVKWNSIIHTFEVMKSIVDDVCRLVSQNLSSKVVQDFWKLLRYGEFLQVFACHS